MKNEVKKHIYPNGLTLLVDEAPQLKSVALAAWVKTGSRHENAQHAGITHFLEHMLFKGNKKGRAIEISKEVDRVGGDFNAFTSREHTCFHFYLPAREIPLGAKLLREVLFQPLFEPKEIERERQVILQEIAMVKESPEEDSYDTYLEKFFGKHPLGGQILGSAKSIGRLKRKTLSEFFHQNYRPENMLLSVSGAVTFERAKRELSSLGEKAWPNRKRAPMPVHEWGSEPPQETFPGFTWQTSDTEQAHLLYGFPAPVHTSKERMASNYIQQYLGGGMSSVLFDQIREQKGWAYTVYASAINFLDASLFTIYAGVKTERVMDSISVFRREMEKIANEGIPQKDLERIRQSLLCSFDLSQENSEFRVMTISQVELFHKKLFSVKEYEKLVSSIKVKDIQALMQSWLKPNGKKVLPTVLVLSAKPKGKVAWKKVTSVGSAITGQTVVLEKQK
jgi:predicted Zn-dependent peptidase